MQLNNSQKDLDRSMNRVAIVVPSCDKYYDLWIPFFNFLRMYWSDCPYKVFLISNHLDAEIPDVKIIKVGDDISWSDNLRKALNLINEDYVMLFIEDLFLFKPVDTKIILNLIEWAASVEANYLRLNPYPAPDIKINGLVGIISRGAIYRTSTVLSVWKKDVLKDLLEPGENAWQFEVNGSERSNKYDGFYSSNLFNICVVNAVIKSRLRRKAFALMKAHYLEPDIKARPLMTPMQELAYFLRRRRAQIFRLIPNAYRTKIKAFAVRN